MHEYFRQSGQTRRVKLALAASLIFDLGMLGVFKYSGFLIENINLLTGLNLPVPQIALPIGISFYTFQTISYVLTSTAARSRRRKPTTNI